MKVSQLIKVLEQLNPELEIYHVQNAGIIAPIRSVQEVSYRGFKPETFIGLACGDKVEATPFNCSPVYISTRETQSI